MKFLLVSSSLQMRSMACVDLALARWVTSTCSLEVKINHVTCVESGGNTALKTLLGKEDFLMALMVLEEED